VTVTISPSFRWFVSEGVAVETMDRRPVVRSLLPTHRSIRGSSFWHRVTQSLPFVACVCEWVQQRSRSFPHPPTVTHSQWLSGGGLVQFPRSFNGIFDVSRTPKSTICLVESSSVELAIPNKLEPSMNLR
jgi:hypothetical protein